jgi:hypothetical protein
MSDTFGEISFSWTCRNLRVLVQSRLAVSHYGEEEPSFITYYRDRNYRALAASHFTVEFEDEFHKHKK